MSISATANNVFRDHVTTGLPGSGQHKPVKAEIRALFGDVEAGLADVAAAAAQRFATLADVNAATIAAGVGTIEITERIAGGKTGGGMLRRVASNPNHGFSTTSNGGTVWWEFMPPTVTPEQGGFTDLAAAATAMLTAGALASGYKTLFLDRRDRTSTVSPLDPRVDIVGPGCDLVTYRYTEHRVGQDLMRSLEANHPGRQTQTARRAVDLNPPVEPSLSVDRSVAQSIPNLTGTILLPTDRRDRCGGYRSAALSAFWVGGGMKRIRARGAVTFAANATGDRQVQLYKNGALVDAQTVRAAALATTCHYQFEIDVSSSAGDYINIGALQTSGGALDVIRWTGVYDVVEQDISTPGGARVLVFQGDWLAQETLKGGFDALAAYIAANYDIGVFSGVETFNDDFGLYTQTPKKPWYNCVGAWANSVLYSAGYRVHDAVADKMYVCLVSHTSPASGTFAAYRTANPTHWRIAVPGDFPLVQSTGYPRLRRLIRRIKQLNRDFEVYGYVSAAADALYWDAGGNPLIAFTLGQAGAFENLKFTIEQWLTDGLEINGIYCDHFYPVYGGSPGISEEVRDAVQKILRSYGLRGCYNIAAADPANLRFAAEGPWYRPSDPMLIEGFNLDNGVSTLTQSNNTLVEANTFHRGRQVRLFLINEEAAGTPIIPGSVNDNNGKSLFNTLSRPGDAYGYSAITYNHI